MGGPLIGIAMEPNEPQLTGSVPQLTGIAMEPNEPQLTGSAPQLTGIAMPPNDPQLTGIAMPPNDPRLANGRPMRLASYVIGRLCLASCVIGCWIAIGVVRRTNSVRTSGRSGASVA